MLTDSVIGAVGWSSSTLNSEGLAVSEWAVGVGHWLAFADEYTAATPDPAAAKALMRQQYDRLTAVS